MLNGYVGQVCDSLRLRRGAAAVRFKAKGVAGRTYEHIAEALRRLEENGRACTPLNRKMRKLETDPSLFVTVYVLERGVLGAELDALESKWIRRLHTLAPSGYNNSDGGFAALSTDADRRKRLASSEAMSAYNRQHNASRCHARGVAVVFFDAAANRGEALCFTTIAAAGRAFGVSPSLLCRWIGGQVRPSHKHHRHDGRWFTAASFQQRFPEVPVRISP